MRTHDSLVAAGVAEDDMYIFWGTGPGIGKNDPFGNPLAGFVDDGTGTGDLEDALVWVSLNTDDDTQLFYGNAWRRGIRAFDLVGWVQQQFHQAIQQGIPYPFDFR